MNALPVEPDRPRPDMPAGHALEWFLALLGGLLAYLLGAGLPE